MNFDAFNRPIIGAYRLPQKPRNTKFVMKILVYMFIFHYFKNCMFNFYLKTHTKLKNFKFCLFITLQFMNYL